jgi:hypothetical protein
MTGEISDATMAAHPGMAMVVNATGDGVDFVPPTQGGTPTVIDGGDASSIDTDVIDGGSATT